MMFNLHKHFHCVWKFLWILGQFRPKGCIKSQDVRYVRSSAFPCQCRLSELFTSLSSLKTFKGKEWSWICICTYNIFEIQIQFEFWQIAYQVMFQKEVLRNKLSFEIWIFKLKSHAMMFENFLREKLPE